jgi:hypothetical protein
LAPDVAGEFSEARGILERAHAVRNSKPAWRRRRIDELIEENFSARRPIEVSAILEACYGPDFETRYWSDQLDPPDLSPIAKFARALALHLGPKDLDELETIAERIVDSLNTAGSPDHLDWLTDGAVRPRPGAEWLIKHCDDDLVPRAVREHILGRGDQTAGTPPKRRAPTIERLVAFLNKGEHGVMPTQQEIRDWARAKENHFPVTATLDLARHVGPEDGLKVRRREVGEKLADPTSSASRRGPFAK